MGTGWVLIPAHVLERTTGFTLSCPVSCTLPSKQILVVFKSMYKESSKTSTTQRITYTNLDSVLCSPPSTHWDAAAFQHRVLVRWEAERGGCCRGACGEQVFVS